MAIKREPTVSIIVPVYNAQATLGRCVGSVLAQDYRDFELLLVDDGSADASGALCDRFAADERVRVFHTDNNGVSAARNRGIAEAAGEYLQFVDSDDWIAPTATGRLVETAQNQRCDMVIADFWRVVGRRRARKGSIDEKGPFSLQDYAACMMKNPADFYYGVLWNKLYRRDIVIQNRLEMDPALHWCEDFMFNLEYLRHVHTVCAVQEPLYYYVRTRGSLASGTSLPKAAKMKRLIFEYYNDFYKTVLSEEDYERVRFRVYRFLIDSADDGTVPRRPRMAAARSLSPQGLRGEDIFSVLYRQEKLLDVLMEPLLARWELSEREGRLLLCLRAAPQPCDRRDLAEQLRTTPQGVSRGMQRLSGKGLLAARELPADRRAAGERRPRPVEVTFLPAAQPLMEELERLCEMYEQVLLAPLNPQERAVYRQLNARTQEAVREKLSQLHAAETADAVGEPQA